MTVRASRLAEGYAQIGHTLTHVMMLLYPTVVLGLEKEFAASYGELLVLMTAGNILVGAGALPAGWLGDRWSARGMMVILFLGLGAAAIVTGLATTTWQIAVGLALLGLAASIYHPVGMAWLVRNAENRGRALGMNGVFGSLGIASSGLLAGWLTDLWSWRAAFIVPGVICLAVGASLAVLIALGRVQDTKSDARPQPPARREDMVRAFVVLSVTMLCTGILHQAYDAALPKLFADRVPSLSGGTAAGAGTMVSIIFFAAMGAQLLGGQLADRFRLRRIYALSYLAQVPLLAAAAQISGVPLYGAMAGAVLLSIVAVPVENSLLSRYSPERWRATAFGAKFVLSAGVSATSVPLIALLYDRTGSFTWLLLVLAAVAAIVALATAWLPREAESGREALAAAK